MSQRPVPRPPQLPTALLRRLVRGPHGDNLAAELFDGYSVRLASGGPLTRIAAGLWYWRQVLSPDTWRLRALARRLRHRGVVAAPDGPAPPWRPLHGLSGDSVFALRSLAATPRFTVAAVLALALGIGAVTSIYGTVGTMLRTPLPFDQLDTLLVVGENSSRATIREDVEAWLHPADFVRVETLSVFEGVAALQIRMSTLTGPGEPEDVVAYATTPDYFRLVGVDALHGRALADDDAADVAVLSHEFWERRFGGDPAAIGTQIRLRDEVVTLIGVLPPGTTYPAGTDLYLPLRLDAAAANDYERRGLTMVARLAQGVTLPRARAALGAATDSLDSVTPESHAQFRLDGMPLRELATFGSRGLTPPLMGAAFFLLLLVCANVASLQLARTTSRGAEIAVRLALGCGRARLVRQLIVESLLLAAFGAALGSLFAIWGTAFLRSQLSHPSIRFYFYGAGGAGVDARALAFAILAGAGAAILSGLTPALHASRADLNAVLKPVPGAAARGTSRIRTGLVVIEIALAVTLIAGAVHMSRSLGALVAFQRGFDTDAALVTVRLRGGEYAEPADRSDFMSAVAERLRALPSIRSVGVSERAPGVNPPRPQEVRIEGNEGTLSAGMQWVDHGYFGSLGIPIVAGRDLTETEVLDGTPVAVASAALAAHYGPANAFIGSHVRIAQDLPVTIIGIAADVSRAWNDGSPARTLYLPYTVQPPRTAAFILATPRPAGVLSAARESIWQEDGRLPVAAHESLRDAIAERSLLYRPITRTTGMFATLAIILALGGVYSVTAYSATMRAWEVGVRMALGARSYDVRKMFVRHAIRVGSAGLALGLPAAWMLTRGLTAFGRGALTSPDGALVLLPVAAGVLAATIAAGYLPARRASQADPVASLRAE